MFELLQLNEAMMVALKNNDTAQFTHAATQSPAFRPLAMAALDYAKVGVTSLDEVMRLVEMVSDTPLEESVLQATQDSDNVPVQEKVPVQESEMQASQTLPKKPQGGGFSLEDID